MDESLSHRDSAAKPPLPAPGPVPQQRSMTVLGSWHAIDARTRKGLDDLRDHRRTLRWDYDALFDVDDDLAPARADLQNSGRTGS